MPPFRLLLSFLATALAVSAQTHPRLFFDADAVPGFRAKAATSPWSDMLASIESAIELQVPDGDGRYPSNYAALHLFRGDGPAPANWSEKALLRSLEYIATPAQWSPADSNALRRGTNAGKVAIAYDLCFHAWAGQTVPASFTSPSGATVTMPADMVGQPVNTVVSRALKDVADSLLATGGSGWPGDGSTSNNWFGVRYGGAALAYLASDETGADKNLDTALSRLLAHLRANLGADPKARGWNVEGIAYAQFPGYTVYPLAIALKRIKNRDLVAEVPAMRLALWSLYQGVLPIPRYSRLGSPGEAGPKRGLGLGLRPDFEDDHPAWLGEGTAALAFAFAPPDYLPGLKWQFRRLVGDLGDRTWDASTGNGLYSLLYYPADLPEQNPAEVWGRAFADDSAGVYIFRDRFQDANDFVFQTKANLRPNYNGHQGPDALSFRLWGLGVPWAVGSGRVYDMKGQTTLFPSDPETSPTPGKGLVPSIADVFQRANGDGYVILKMETSDTGVERQTRRLLADYSGTAGAPGVFIISDSSANGRFWRLNTPDFNKIEVAPGAFTITAPTGEKLRATILWPPKATPRTGAFKRGSPFPYKDVNWDPATRTYGTQNKWVDFESPDGHFVVALTVNPAGAHPPAVSARGAGARQLITIGAKTYAFDNDTLAVAGWTRPVIEVVAPAADAHYPHRPASIPVSGRVTDPDGIARVELWLNGSRLPDATVSPSGDWSAALADLPPGPHSLEIIAVDRVADRQSARRDFQVHRSAPPELFLTYPGTVTPVAPGEELVLHGVARDPDATPVTVTLALNGKPLGNASADTSTGAWSYRWPAVPAGLHTLVATATAADGDTVSSPPLTLAASLRFSPAPRWGDAARYRVLDKDRPVPLALGAPTRWSVATEDGDLRLLLRGLAKFDYTQHRAVLVGSDEPGLQNFRLTFRAKPAAPLTPESHLWVQFGRGAQGPLALDLRAANGVLPAKSWNFASGRGTRVWNPDNGGARREIAWSLRPHAPADPGYPNAAATDAAGIPGPAWAAYQIDRFGTTLRVTVNNRLILDTTHPLLGTKGAVAFANDTHKGTPSFIDDVDLQPLSPTGQPLADQPAAFRFDSPAPDAALAPGADITLAGKVADRDGIATLRLFLGAHAITELTPTGADWSATWRALPGRHSFHLELTDRLGNTTRSPEFPLTVPAPH